MGKIIGMVPLTIWGFGVIIATTVAGFSWMMQGVELPLVWLLILTFVPTDALIKNMQNRLRVMEKND